VYGATYTGPGADVCQNGCDLEELANTLSGKKQARALQMDTFNKNTFKTKWEKKNAELEQEKSKAEQNQESIKTLEGALEKIKTDAETLNFEIKELNEEIENLQKVYDQATEELVAMLAEVDGIINNTKVNKQLEDAKNFMGESFVEVYDNGKTKTKLWVDAEIDKIRAYMDSPTLKCDQNAKTQKPPKPSSATATFPPAAP